MVSCAGDLDKIGRVTSVVDVALTLMHCNLIGEVNATWLVFVALYTIVRVTLPLLSAIPELIRSDGGVYEVLSSLQDVALLHLRARLYVSCPAEGLRVGVTDPFGVTLFGITMVNVFVTPANVALITHLAPETYVPDTDDVLLRLTLAVPLFRAKLEYVPVHPAPPACVHVNTGAPPDDCV